MSACVTHLNNTVYGQVYDDIDDEEGQYGSGYSHTLVHGTDNNTTVIDLQNINFSGSAVK